MELPIDLPTVTSSITVTMQDEKISQTVSRETQRLRRFISRYVSSRVDAEDILQDVFSELVATYRLMKPVEQVGAWLLRVAHNRIVDRFRKRQREVFSDESIVDEEGELFTWDEFLPEASGGPEQALLREAMLEQIELALETLTPLQREVFVLHELEGKSFKEISSESGIGVNTLLARKHEAVRALRKQLQTFFDDLN